MIKRLTLSNILSFGPKEHAVELGDLNVLIGANGSGKSNFIDILRLIQALPRDIAPVFREGGGSREWPWKGGIGVSEMKLVIESDTSFSKGVHHTLGFWDVLGRPMVTREEISGRQTHGPLGSFNFKLKKSDGTPNPTQSILVRPSDDIATIGLSYDKIAIYQDWPLGRNSVLRKPQPADLPDDILLSDGSNLGLVLNAMQRHPQRWDMFREALRQFYPSFGDIQFVVQGGTIQIFFREKGMNALIPATRLSDGTLRYLALLAILLSPTPPEMVVLEEPEIGLHPDIIGDLAHHLEDAATRTQVVITTHSDHLINALSHRPEAVLVTERDEEGTKFHRLDRDQLAAWLERYTLGDLWMKGEIGGTRW